MRASFRRVTALTLLALVLGCWGALHSPLDVFPEFVPSQVDIQTEAPGFAPQQVEELVTKPIENAVNGATGLATLRSESIPGLSVVTITFGDGVDVHVARQGISERLSELGSTPAGRRGHAEALAAGLEHHGPAQDRAGVGQGRCLHAARHGRLDHQAATAGGARRRARHRVRRRRAPDPDPARPAEAGELRLHADRCGGCGARRAAAARRGLHRHRRAARPAAVADAAPDVDAIGQAAVMARNSTPILLREVAEVKEAPALRSGDALIMGKPRRDAVAGQPVWRQHAEHHAGGREGAGGPAAGAEEPGITMYPGLHRPANFIERALGDLKQSLVIAAVLILAVLYLFLRDLRAALIAFTAIPLSLLAAVAVLDRMGLTLNTMTLGGFAVALGVLVDDAIIGIENILRRLRENARCPRRAPGSR